MRVAGSQHDVAALADIHRVGMVLDEALIVVHAGLGGGTLFRFLAGLACLSLQSP